MRNVLYRGNRRGLNLLFETIDQGGQPLVVHDNTTTGIVRYEPPVTNPDYTTPLMQAAMSTVSSMPAHPAYRPRQYRTNPKSLGDRLLDTYATALESWDTAWSVVKGRFGWR